MVYKIHKTKDYTVMSNTHLKDKNLSLKAKGLLSVMLSLPDNWDYSVEGLVAISKENMTAVRSTLVELEEYNYLIRERKQNAKGRIEYEYHIFETPHTEIPHAEEPHAENPYTVNPHTENSRQLNTYELNTYELNTYDKKTKDKKSIAGGFDLILSEIENPDLRELYYEFLKMRKLRKSPMTELALKMLINKVNELAPADEEMQKKLLQESILHNWQSVYPLKEEQAQPKQKPYGVTSGTQGTEASYDLAAATEYMNTTVPKYKKRK